MKQTKKALISSVLVLVLCLSSLIGTTFAWFTDVASSKNNIIQTGELDAAMYWSNDLLDADSTAWIDASTSSVFTNTNWEPGNTEVKYIKVANEGSINLKWKLIIEADGVVSSLSDVIDVYYVNPVTEAVTDLDGRTSAGNLTKVLADKVETAGTLDKETNVILAIAFHMDENAGNAYKNLSLCEEGFSLKLYATQIAGEYNYTASEDDDEDWFNTVNFSASASLDDIAMNGNTIANDVVIGDGTGVNATLPADVKLADGVSNVELSVTNAETSGNISLGENDTAKSLDVHIEGIAEDNTVPMIVNLGAILAPGMSETALKLYHIENDVPVLMTRVASADDFTIHNQYTYNATTGEVTIYVASFSVFSLVNAQPSKWTDNESDKAWYNDADTEFTLTNAAQFVGFRDLVDSGKTFEGKTVKLATDIDLNEVLFDPIGFDYDHRGGKVFKGTFDGAGHVIYNLYQQGWDLEAATGVDYTYSTAGGGLFASIKDATIKNLAVSGASIVFECIDMGVVVGYAQGNCTLDNIVVTKSTIANYQRYTGAVVGEISSGNPSDDTLVGQLNLKNITVDSSVVVSSLWGDFDTSCGGVLGGKWGNAKVDMTNVTTAAKLDVYSDVTAAYQWYAYRRCGMLIGHTEQNSPKKALNAAADFLTCKNVKVYYGDWVNYTYYQYTNQDNDWCNNYPWVRAEAGLNNPAFSNVRYGVPVVKDGITINRDNASDHCTDYTPIVFDQLYGGGQGVYGAATHTGVDIFYENSVRIQIFNNKDWEDLTFEYWFAHGDDKWTTLVDGISVAPNNNNVYVLNLPTFAAGFKVTSKSGASVEFIIADLTKDTIYNLDHEVVAEGSTGSGSGGTDSGDVETGGDGEGDGDGDFEWGEW